MVFFRAMVAIAAVLLSVAEADPAVQCTPSKQCPQETPCCSQYGQCGIGAYCLGGCDPLSSHSLDSCMPAPVCSSQNWKFDSMNIISQDTDYLGNASSAGWVASGKPKTFKDGDDDVVLLTLPENSAGTLLASTSYVWYGKMTATMKSSRTQGVVTAFIMFSDVKDEIDFEFVGYNTNQAQTNFYWQGVNNFTNGANSTVQDTFDDYHTYVIDWKPDTLTWSIDGNTVRTLNRADTWNETTKAWGYPQTPARVELSLWPAGISSNAAGTVAWSGGPIDWNATDVQQAGYFYAMIKEVDIQCYDPPGGANKNGDQAYIYTTETGLNNSIQITNKGTILKSLEGTGLDPDVASSSAAPSSVPTNQVPGADSGTGNAGAGANGDQGGSSNGGSPTQGASAPTGSTFFGFSQGNTNEGTHFKDEKVLRGSMLAVFLAIAGLLAL